jgi:glutamine synthetase
VLPGRGDGGVARMFCDVLTPEGEPFDGDPRWVLRRNLERAAGRGFTVYVMPELEFFLFGDAETGRPLDIGSSGASRASSTSRQASVVAAHVASVRARGRSTWPAPRAAR